MSNYRITYTDGTHNDVVADEYFMEKTWPGQYQLLPDRSANLTWDNAPPEYWWIFLGSFYDRFGTAAMLAVIQSKDPTVQALIEVAKVRQYIDLRREDLIQFMGLLQQAVPAVTAEIAAFVLNSPTTETERYVKGLPQPQDSPSE